MIHFTTDLHPEERDAGEKVNSRLEILQSRRVRRRECVLQQQLHVTQVDLSYCRQSLNLFCFNFTQMVYPEIKFINIGLLSSCTTVNSIKGAVLAR